MPQDEQAAIRKRLEWLDEARPKQIISYDPNYNIILCKAGRAFGKTRLAVENAWWRCFERPNYRYAVVCATRDDVRKVAFEGESGFYNRIPPEIILPPNKHLLQIKFKNGSLLEGYSAEEPNRLRGPQFNEAWADELASWQYEEAWDMLEFCVRLGDHTMIVVTTTPKNVPIIKKLDLDSRCLKIIGSTYENKANLSENYLRRLSEKYEGTRLGKQELHGIVLDDVEGALWNQEMIEAAKQPVVMLDVFRTVIAIDPAASANAASDETGIIAACKDDTNRGFILEDFSGKYSPDTWANKALYAYDKYNGDCIVAEVNNGGDMVEAIIKHKRPNVRVIKIHAKKSKYLRAEPVSALYEQFRIFHISKDMVKLEDQMTSYVPGAKESPDRLDAAVYALSELFQIKQDALWDIV